METQAALDLPATESRRFTLDLSEIQAEIMKRHGAKVRRDDPALMVLTGFELIGLRLAAHFELAVERANDDTSAAMAQHIEASKAIAAAIVDRAAAYHSERIQKTVDDLAPKLAADTKALLLQVGKEIGATRERVEHAARMVWIGVALSGALFLATATLVVGALFAK